MNPQQKNLNATYKRIELLQKGLQDCSNEISRLLINEQNGVPVSDQIIIGLDKQIESMINALKVCQKELENNK